MNKVLKTFCKISQNVILQKVLRRNFGLSLIETIVYIGLLGFVAVFVSSSLIQIVNAYNFARAEREVISNARLILETVNKSIAQAGSVYGPTSVFYSDSGQLSLLTTIEATAEHTTNFVDFWVDNGTFLVKKEGQPAAGLSASSVRVTRFYLERIIQGLNREAVRVTIRVDYANPKFSSSVTLNSTTALRGNY